MDANEHERQSYFVLKYIPKERVMHRLNYIQIYHVWEGYLRKIPVERSRDVKFPEPNDEGNLVSRLVFFVNTPPKHDISV